MKEFKLEKPIEIKLEQFECQACKKKIYVNEEDFNEAKILDCPFCDVQNINNTRLFEVEIKKIFEKTMQDF